MPNIFENKKIAQIFSIYDSSLSKVSIYLKPNIQIEKTSFDMIDRASIDILNFYRRSEGSSIVIPNDVNSGFTGKGYLESYANITNDDYQIVYFKIKPQISGLYKIWIRGQQLDTDNFKVNCYVNGMLESAINDNGSPSSSWNWYNAEVNLTSNTENTLGIQMNNPNITIDKIYILISSAPAIDEPSGDGPDYDTSPYITMHAQIYSTDSNFPTSPLFIHDYKTTLEDIKTSGWYNFNIKSIKDDVSYTFNGQYALVLFSIGSNNENNIYIETQDSSEYEFAPIAEKVF